MKKKSQRTQVIIEDKRDRLDAMPKTALVQFLLCFGGGSIALAVFIILSWKHWEIGGTLLATLLPTLLCYLVAWKCCQYSRRLAYLCTIVACLLLPLSLASIFHELGYNGHLGLLTASTSLFSYVVLILLIDLAVLTSFQAIASCFCYYYLLKFFGLHSFGQAMSLLFLVPCGTFLAAGIWCERTKRVENCRRLYFVAAMVFFTMILQWAKQGSFLKVFAGEDAIGLSLALAALLFMATAFFLGKAKLYRLPILGEYAVFFKTFGALFFLGALLWLSHGGGKMIYGSILLLSILAFILSAYLKSRKKHRIQKPDVLPTKVYFDQ